MKNKILLLGLFCCSLISANAQVLLDKGTGKNSFPIVSSSTNAVVCFDGKDATVVRKSASLFVDDVRRVTGQELKMDESKPGKVSARYAIIAGTIGESGCIIRKSKFPQNPKRSVRFSGKRTKRSVQKRKARNTQKAETKVL